MAFQPFRPAYLAVVGGWSGFLLWLDTLPPAVGLALLLGIGGLLGVHLEIALRQRLATDTGA